MLKKIACFTYVIILMAFLGYNSPICAQSFILYEKTDKQPSFNGGDINAFIEWVDERLVYPTSVKTGRKKGTVNVWMLIKPDGTVTGVQVLGSNGVDPELDKEAIRVVSSSPKWEPGYKDGKPVSVGFNVPIEFSMTHKVRVDYSGGIMSEIHRLLTDEEVASRMQRGSSSNSNSGTQFPRSVTNKNKQTSLTTVVWATPAGNEVFKLYSDGTADVKMDVSYRTKWEQDDDEFIFIGGTGTVKQWMLDSSTGSVFAVYASSVTQRPVARLVKR